MFRISIRVSLSDDLIEIMLSLFVIIYGVLFQSVHVSIFNAVDDSVNRFLSSETGTMSHFKQNA